MEIFAHRGTWTAPSERNSLAALERAWRSGHGVETDLRDLDGEVVVSHDPPRRTDPAVFTLRVFLDRWAAAGRPGRLALNVKADGLAAAIADQLSAEGVLGRVFVFDMSVPDQLAHERCGLPVLARWSEIETPVRTPGVRGLWLDAFSDDSWWDPAGVRTHLEQGSDVVLVSPELHGRPFLPTWERVRAADLHRSSGFGICTDVPDRAQEFFA